MNFHSKKPEFSLSHHLYDRISCSLGHWQKLVPKSSPGEFHQPWDQALDWAWLLSETTEGRETAALFGLPQALLVHWMWHLYFSGGWESPQQSAFSILKLFQMNQGVEQVSAKHSHKSHLPRLPCCSDCPSLLFATFASSVSSAQTHADTHTHTMVMVLFLSSFSTNSSNIVPSLKCSHVYFSQIRTLFYRTHQDHPSQAFSTALTLPSKP